MPLEPGMMYTLRDLALHGDGDKSQRIVINMLSRANPMLEDALWLRGNRDTGHVFNLINGLPSVNYRSVNEGVHPTRGSMTELVETISHLEATSVIDNKLIELAENGNVFRMFEAQAHIESMANKFAEEIWYGSLSRDPRSVIGLAQSYKNLTGPAWRQIIDASDDTTGPSSPDQNSSIWIIVWGERGFHCIYPKNMPGSGGITYIPGQLENITDTMQGPGYQGTFRGYLDRFEWQIGRCLKDYRQVARIANIDMEKLRTTGSGNDIAPDLYSLLIRLTHRIHNLGTWNAQDTSPQGGIGVPSPSGKAVIYMNRDVAEYYELQLTGNRRGALAVTYDQETGARSMSFKGIPIKVDDNLLTTEERIV